MLRWLIGNILGEIICKSSNWQHIQRLKITILGANWQLVRLERIAKCSYFILSTQNIKFYWFVMKIKKFMLPIWWCNRGLFPLGNTYFGVFILNGISAMQMQISSKIRPLLVTTDLSIHQVWASRSIMHRHTQVRLFECGLERGFFASTSGYNKTRC